MIWKIASLYIATVIGAGFATGQELVQFFAYFGITGLVGVVLATIVLSICGGITLQKCVELGTDNYKQLILRLNKSMTPFLDLIYTLFLMLGIAIMFAGTESVFLQLTKFNNGMYLSAVLVMIPLIFGPEKILELSGYLVPVMILCMGYVAIVTVLRGTLVLPSGHVMGIPSGLLYAGYNYGFSVAVFASLGQVIKNQRHANKGGLLGGLVLGLIVILVVIALFSSSPEILAMPIPMLTLAQQISPTTGFIYSIVIWLGMYTTALAHVVAVAHRMKPMVRIKWWQLCLIVIIIALCLGKIGFIPLIKLTYPTFGIIGLYLLYKILQL